LHTKFGYNPFVVFCRIAQGNFGILIATALLIYFRSV